MMARKLIPLTDELQDEQSSFSKLRTWEPQPHVSSMPSGEHLPAKKEKKSKKILSMISQWGASKSGKKFEIFSTKKVSGDAKVAAVSHETRLNRSRSLKLSAIISSLSFFCSRKQPLRKVRQCKSMRRIQSFI
jgi:hypothetical protein